MTGQQLCMQGRNPSNCVKTAKKRHLSQSVSKGVISRLNYNTTNLIEYLNKQHWKACESSHAGAKGASLLRLGKKGGCVCCAGCAETLFGDRSSSRSHTEVSFNTIQTSPSLWEVHHVLLKGALWSQSYKGIYLIILICWDSVSWINIRIDSYLGLVTPDSIAY